jgi:hypothetical protein
MRHHLQLLLQLQLHLLWVSSPTGYLPLQQLQTAAQQQRRPVSGHAHTQMQCVLEGITPLEEVLSSQLYLPCTVPTFVCDLGGIVIACQLLSWLYCLQQCKTEAVSAHMQQPKTKYTNAKPFHWSGNSHATYPMPSLCFLDTCSIGALKA